MNTAVVDPAVAVTYRLACALTNHYLWLPAMRSIVSMRTAKLTRSVFLLHSPS